MSGHRLKALTYRVENIPFGTTKEQLVRNYFYVKDQEDIKVKSLVPAVDTIDGEEGDCTATLLFRPHEPRPDGPRVQDDSIVVDQDFCGFTPLYVPSKDKGPIAADIIAVTGLAGHAFGSWAHSDEQMWLRDYLPKDAPNARILTYGYYSKLQGSSSVNILQDHTNKFVHGLIDMREEGQCESRPIIFIGHSLGCLIIKKALTDALSHGINSSRFPVRGIIFLAAPHRGLDITALQTLVKGEPTEQMILELKSESPTLTWLNQSFSKFAQDIDILTCYENKPTKTVVKVDGVWKREGPSIMMVTPDSARQYYPKEKLVSADSDHSQIAKIKKGQNGIYPAVKAAIKHGLVSTARIVAGAGETNGEISSFVEQIYALHLGSQQPFPPPYPLSSGFESQLKRQIVEQVGEIPPTPQPVTCESTEEYPTGSKEIFATPGTDRQDSSPSVAVHRQSSPYCSGHDIHDTSSQSPRQPSMNGVEIQPQQIVSEELHIDGANLPSPVEDEQVDEGPDEEFDEETDEDEELDEMIAEFEEMIDCSPGQYIMLKCQRCEDPIGDSDYHYACKVCVKYSALKCVCQQCYEDSESCWVHGGEMFKRADKPWYAVYQWSEYIDPEVTETDDDMTRALKENNIADIRYYAENNQLLNAHGHLGFTPLHVAAHLGLEEGARALLEYGALIESREYQNSTPLLTAIEQNQTRMVKLLLDSGASVGSVCGVNSSTALHCAAANGMWHMITILLRSGAAVDAPSGRGTALQLSARVGSDRCAEALLAAGANPNAKSERAYPALCNAASDGHGELVKLLLQYGADVDLVEDMGCTPLMLAAENGHRDICEDLLDQHAHMDTQSTDGLNAVTMAANHGHEDIVDLLLERGASGAPPRALSGKWKKLWFEDDVPARTRESILSKLRAVKHAKGF